MIILSCMAPTRNCSVLCPFPSFPEKKKSEAAWEIPFSQHRAVAQPSLHPANANPFLTPSPAEQGNANKTALG